jgi:CelD/BcsL family acetyltransferase involved in cellulose biosynthesis
LRVLIARTLKEVDCLRPAWESLQHSSLSIFQSFAWNRMAAKAFDDREAPYVVYTETGGGAALVPAAVCREGTLVVFLGETLFDYRTVLATGDEDALEVAWGEIGRLRQQLWVMGVPQPWTAHWRSWRPERFSEAPHVLAREISAERFAAEHTRAARQLRRLQGQGCEPKRYPGSAGKLVEFILRRKSEQLWGEPNNLFADPRRIEFLQALLALRPQDADIFTLEQDSEIVSAIVTIRDGNTRRFYNTYHDERWAKLSPGVALIYEVTRLSLADGLDCDYMTGTQSHKTRFATSTVPLYRIDATPEQVAARAAGQQLPAA